MAIERVTVNVPAGFDPNRHTQAVLKKIAAERGDGFRIENYDPDLRVVTATRSTGLMQIRETGSNVKVIELQYGVKPTDGDRIDQRLADQYPGYRMTTFDPYLLRAELKKLTADEVRCRSAVAVTLGVKPWDVQCESRRGDGFKLVLPKQYVPSKHDKGLEEVATTVVGRFGWYVKVDVRALTAEIIPGEPVTFERSYPYPFDQPVDTFTIPIGIALGKPGVENSILDVNLSDNAGGIVQGLAGAGKSVLVNNIVYGSLRAGHQIVILDIPHKKTDFAWVQPYVRENGWGCESKAEAVAAASLVYEEGLRRGQLLEQHRVLKWQDLPADVKKKNPIISIFADELTGLFSSDPIPKSLPKDHPVRMEAEQLAAETDLLKAKLLRIPAELRAAGIRLWLATQQAQSNTGIPPAFKLNLPNKALLGAAATKQARGHALSNPDAAPLVPEHVASDEWAAKGAGVAELEGRPSVVMKSYYASTDELVARLEKMGAPKAKRQRPTDEQVDLFVPRLSEDGDENDQPLRTKRSGDSGGGERNPISGRLTSEVAAEMGDDMSWKTGDSAYERANAARHASKVQADAWEKKQKEEAAAASQASEPW